MRYVPSAMKLLSQGSNTDGMVRITGILGSRGEIVGLNMYPDGIKQIIVTRHLRLTLVIPYLPITLLLFAKDRIFNRWQPI